MPRPLRARILVLVALVTGVVSAAHPSPAGSGPFPDGVAARARIHSVRIWSRADAAGEYRYQIATDKQFRDIVRTGSVEAKTGSDFVLRRKADGLDSRRRYFYRFLSTDGDLSARGKFTTLPSRGKSAAMKLAFTGDSDIEWTDHPDDGTTPFEAFKRIKEEAPDLFVYMGDTIYSDSETGSPPALTRSEKWAKYRANRTAALKSLLRSTSTLAMWDDHEVINDFDGARLALEDPALLEAGVKAFDDYWPGPRHWPIAGNRAYGKLSFGSKIDIFYLDERMYREQSADGAGSPCYDSEGSLDLAPTLTESERAELGLPPVDPACLAHLNDEPRTMLGAEQKQWFKRALKRSDARWKLVLNEVPMVQLYVLPYDRWEGYPQERAEVLSFIGDKDIRGVVFLTTDIHAHIGTPTFVDIRDTVAPPVAYEVVTGPVQTCTIDCEVDEILGSPLGGEILKAFLLDHDLVYEDPEDGLPHCANLDAYGYATITAEPDADSLKVAWKSNREGKTGGRRIQGCPARRLRP